MNKLKEIVEKSNKNADFTCNYKKNKALRKKLFTIGSPIAICGFVIAVASFVLIGVFGTDLKSIKLHTGLLISMFVLLVLFSVVFAIGLYILKQASSLHTEKQEDVQQTVENVKNNQLNKN